MRDSVLGATVVTIRAAFWIAVAGVFKFLMPLPRLVALIGGRPTSVARDTRREASVIACVNRAARWLRVDDREGNCLERSLALYRMLAQLGAAPVLVVGFRREDERLLGHAWLTLDGEPVGEPQPADYATVVQYGAARS